MTEMVRVKALREHVRQMHRRQPPAGLSDEQLARWHSREHHRYATSHYHEGVNLGPSCRPEGWRTGEGAVERGSR